MQKLTASQLCESQQAKYYAALLNPNIPSNHIILKTSDEKTGKRFDEAAKRKGQCVKIGSGGRNKGRVGYQIWLSWALVDIHHV